MRVNNTDTVEVSDRPTRRRALQVISGIVLGGSAIGTAAANRHVTEIDEPTVIDEPGTYVLASNINSEAAPAIRIVADRVTLKGDGHSIARDEGSPIIEAEDVTNVTITNVNLASAGRTGIEITNARGCTVERVTGPSVAGDLDLGIQCQETHNTILRQNSFRGSERSGIRISGSNNRVQNNHGHNVEDGITVRGSNNIVQDNRIGRGSSATGYPALSVSGSNNTVRGNDIHAGEDGIIIGGHGHTVENNTVSAVWAVYLLNEGNNTVTNNEVSYADIGFLLFDSDDNTLTRNKVRDAAVGIDLDESSDHNTVARNDLRGAHFDGIRDKGENNRIHANITD